MKQNTSNEMMQIDAWRLQKKNDAERMQQMKQNRCNDMMQKTDAKKMATKSYIESAVEKVSLEKSWFFANFFRFWSKIQLKS